MPIDKEGNYFVYAIVANIIDKYYKGIEKHISRGTKQFRPGAKVYCIFIYGGMGHERLIVIGKPRKTGRLIALSMIRTRLKNYRVQKVYSPKIIELLTEHEFYRKPTKEFDFLLFNSIKDENTKSALLEEWATPPKDLLDWVNGCNEPGSNIELNENDWSILFTYGGEGGGGIVYQIPTGTVWLKHNETGLPEEDILPVNIEREFDNWETFWQYHITKYPHWKQLHPKFYK